MFSIHSAGLTPTDVDFIVAAMDSCLPVLAKNGNVGQWGTTPFSKQDGFLEATRHDVAQAERFRLTGQGERLRIFMARVMENESETKGDLHHITDLTEHEVALLTVGAVVIRDDEFAKHVIASKPLAPYVAAAKAAGGFVFIDLLIADHRVDPAKRKGSGRALIEHVKEYAREHGKRTVLVDCWAGGNGRLGR